MTSMQGGPIMEFERVSRLPAHHLHGATLQDGPRLWTVAAFGGEVSLCATAGGVSAGQLMSPCVARAIVIELGRALRALGEQQQES